MKVTHYIRDQRPGNYSIETIFESVRKNLDGRVSFRTFVAKSPFHIGSLLRSVTHQSQVNHITGDINYYALLLSSAKTILTVHDLGYFENNHHSKWKRIIYKSLWLRKPLMSVKYVTTVSEFTKRKILQYFNIDENKIFVIPNPINEVFRPAPRPRNEKFTILQIGSGKHKNLDGLISAVKNLNCRLSIIGRPAPDELERLTKYKIDYEIYSNLSTPEVYKKYCQTDILFFASHYEGFGIPIIEANATGRPVITSRRDAMLEVAGDAAYFVDPDDSGNIRAAITTLMADDFKFESLVQKGLVNRERFSNEAICEKYYSIYKKVVNGV